MAPILQTYRIRLARSSTKPAPDPLDKALPPARETGWAFLTACGLTLFVIWPNPASDLPLALVAEAAALILMAVGIRQLTPRVGRHLPTGSG